MLLSMEGALHVSIDCDNDAWSGHFKLQRSIVRHRIEFGKCGSSEQGVIAVAEWDYVED